MFVNDMVHQILKNQLLHLKNNEFKTLKTK